MMSAAAPSSSSRYRRVLGDCNGRGGRSATKVSKVQTNEPTPRGPPIAGLSSESMQRSSGPAIAGNAAAMPRVPTSGAEPSPDTPVVAVPGAPSVGASLVERPFASPVKAMSLEESRLDESRSLLAHESQGPPNRQMTPQLQVTIPPLPPQEGQPPELTGAKLTRTPPDQEVGSEVAPPSDCYPGANFDQNVPHQGHSIMNGANRVNVFAREKPLSVGETGSGTVADASSCTVHYNEVDGAGDCKTASKQLPFEFDGVFPYESSQGDVFGKVGLPVLRGCLGGCHGTIIAYGQTSGGKTYSLLNDGKDKEGRIHTEKVGLLPRLVTCLFEHVAQDVAHVYEIEAAALWVYNERVEDLLHPDYATGGGHNMIVYKKSGKVPGLTEEKCHQPEDLLNLFVRAREKIVYAETKMNKASSRGHAVFQVKIKKRLRVTEAQDGQGSGSAQQMKGTWARLNVVDLAGSERTKKSGVEGDQMRVASAINKSLFEFSNVVSALAAKKKFVPFRNSKLTQVLQSSIGGDTNTSLLVCFSPSGESCQETLSTLRFASRAMQIEVAAKVNVDVGMEAGNERSKAEFRQLQHEKENWLVLEAKLQNSLKQAKIELEEKLAEEEQKLALCQQEMAESLDNAEKVTADKILEEREQAQNIREELMQERAKSQVLEQQVAEEHENAHELKQGALKMQEELEQKCVTDLERAARMHADLYADLSKELSASQTQVFVAREQAAEASEQALATMNVTLEETKLGLAAEMDALKEEVAKADFEKQTASELLATSQSELQAERDEVKALELQLAAERDLAEEHQSQHSSELELMQEEFTRQVQELTANSAKMEEEKLRMEEDVGIKKAVIQELEAKVDAAIADAEYLQTSVEEGQREAADKRSAMEAEVELLQQDVKTQKEVNDANAQLHGEISFCLAEAETELAAKKEENNSLQEKIRELEATLTEVCVEAEKQHAKHEAYLEQQLASEAIREPAAGEKLATALAQGAEEEEELVNYVVEKPLPRAASQRSPQVHSDSPPASTATRKERPVQGRTGQRAAPTSARNSQSMRSPPKTRGAQPSQDFEAQLAQVKKESAAHKKAVEEAEALAAEWHLKAEELGAELEELNRAPRKKVPAMDWTKYGVDEELDGEDVDEQVRIQYLTVTSEQLRSHCQTLEVENASMKDLMAAFEFSLEQHAQIIGHVNHKQKIRYTLQLKETINRLLEELRRSRQRIFQLENITMDDDLFEVCPGKPWATASRSTTTTTTRTTLTMDAPAPARRRSTGERSSPRH